ncbi:GreA/GreB family elongation factor [Cohnella endophytica]|uniref:GreA/GreB family elongation factor n=1 Tax=Cohnella endophytica TaxID=2419778 RepID=A0A494XBH5_9BACL|nr:GreA/GreB family elongation factor [Cohnella endophytica]RKP47910.1 GreA/GreB family elongation factor [Cohnella endophytica]
MNHSREDTLGDNLREQLLFFDENGTDIINTYPNLADRMHLNKFIATYRHHIGQYLERSGNNAEEKYVWIGSKVTIRYEAEGDEETLTIVLPHQVDVELGHISFLSPVGQHLLLSENGHRIEIDSPAGKYWITVVNVSD